MKKDRNYLRYEFYFIDMRLKKSTHSAGLNPMKTFPRTDF